MSSDPTMPQGGPERRQSQEKSLERNQPPTQVPGYETERFLGVGAYGEVWVAVEQNTGRRVAIKFYTHRGGLDWSLLSREVEKLAFLFADRYVVQLIGVGWDSDPPYYIMEYLEQGSLARRLESGPMPVAEAVDVFRDVAVGLVHSHGKGVLHCDLKPANILLDQDRKPRLADFGQSRLSHEQAPALGTLFYMAPEQADLQAVPDARWDVYALGALLYCMLTGRPPHRNEQSVARLERAGSLARRLSHYRRMIRNEPVPTDHRQVPGVDRGLAEILERCLAADPKKRYPNVQAVLAALDARDASRARLPMMILGAVGPALVLAVVSMFAWIGFGNMLREAGDELTESSLKGNRFAAQAEARSAGYELERRFEAVEEVAYSESLRQALRETLEGDPDIQELLDELSDPGPLGNASAEAKILEPKREKFRALEARKRLQAAFEKLIPDEMTPVKPGTDENGIGLRPVASWFFCDERGVSSVRVPNSKTIGKNYAWRSYFHGESPLDGWKDYEPSWRPEQGEHVKKTELSAAFTSQANNQWIVAVTCPVYEKPPSGGKFLGVVALTVKVGWIFQRAGGREEFGESQAAVVVDQRKGEHEGMILQHPLYEDKDQDLQRKLARLNNQDLKLYRLEADKLPNSDEAGREYVDPFAALGRALGKSPPNEFWLAQAEPVLVRGQETGWWVIVQEPYDKFDGTIGWTLDKLKGTLILYGLTALGMVLLVVLGLWGFSIRLLREASPGRLSLPVGDPTERTSPSVTPDAPTDTHT